MTKNYTFPNPWDLIYFQELAAVPNLSRAAERLGVSQPALSLSLKRLEANLGAVLFHRRHRGLDITPEGEDLLRECTRLMNDWAAIASEARRSKQEVRGRYRLGCHPSVAIYGLKDVVRDLYSDFPEIEIHLGHGLSREVCEQVISGKMDFGLVVNPVPHPDLVISKIAKDEVCFWHKAGGLKDTLIYNPDMLQSQTLLKKYRERKFPRSLHSGNLEVIATLAASGAGTAILPTRVVQSMAPSLRKVPDAPTFIDEITFVHRSDLPKTAGARAILERMKALKI